MAAVNLLTGNNATFSSSIGDWTIDSPHSLNVTNAYRKFPGPPLNDPDNAYKYVSAVGTAVAIPDDEDGFVVSSPTVTTGLRETVRSFIWVYADVYATVDASVTYGIHNTATTFTETESLIQIFPNKWTLVSVSIDTNQGTFSNQNTLAYTLTFDNYEIPAGSAHFYLSFPAIVSSDEPTINAFARETYMRFPNYLQDSDAEQTNPDIPLYRYLAGYTVRAGEIYDTWKSFRAVPPDEATDARPEQTSYLVDPTVCNTEYLPWLACLLGMKLQDSTTGLSDWLSIEALSSTEIDGLGDWSTLETEIDAANVFSAVSLSRASGTVTADFPSAHGLATDDVVVVNDSGDATFDGEFVVVTVVDTDTVEWTQAGSTASTTGDVYIPDTTWQELQAFAAAQSSSNAIEFLREQVAGAFFGIKAGTRQTFTAIIRSFRSEALEQTNGTPSITYQVHAAGNPWLIRVYVSADEIVSGADAIEEALRLAAPAGYQVECQAIDPNANIVFQAGSVESALPITVA